MRGGRTNRWALVVGALLLLATSSVGANGSSQPRLVAYGDSYVAPGEHGEAVGLRSWLKLVHRPILSLGHAGDGVADTLRVVQATRYRATQDVVLEVGINDVRRHGDDDLAQFVDDFGAVLDLLGGTHRVVVVLPLPILDWGPKGSDDALLLYRAAERELATMRPNVRVADAQPRWQAATMLLPDGIHPGVSGRVVIADAVQEALRGR